ncbi:host attachment protein [Thiomonas sp.]|jgi:protein required for attachment to host cells|uniref:host attachment protein n=1 Tax=Thiomonas sp. TaxID=2047785 RepID=UPI00260A3A14|nr:host attachment protein [Thiomonas sp.]
MKKTYVLVANRASARLFTIDSPIGPLHEIEVLTHPQARLRNEELGNATPGRTQDRVGTGRHAIDPDEPPREHELDVFAKSLAERLQRARTTEGVQALALVAAPETLGALRQHLDAATRALIVAEVSKNLVHLPPEQIRKDLPERIGSAVA